MGHAMGGVIDPDHKLRVPHLYDGHLLRRTPTRQPKRDTFVTEDLW